MRKSLLLTVAAASLLAVGSSAVAAGTWVPANVPLGGADFALSDINDRNIVTGSYTNASGIEVGVFGPFDGSNYQTIDDKGGDTQPRGLNDKVWIVGFDAARLEPWERSPSGTLKYITKRGNLFQGMASAISNANVFVGNYTNAKGVGIGGIGTKFKWYKWTGRIKCTIANTGCAIRGIDAAGDVDGWYDDSSGIQHGFYQPASGAAVKIDYPDAFYTVVEGLNDNGMASGQWEGASGVIHGFVYDIAKKSFTSLDAPGAAFTQAWGINNHNVIAVSAAESSGTESFAYCMSAKGCPGAGAALGNHQRRSPRKAEPRAN